MTHRSLKKLILENCVTMLRKLENATSEFHSRKGKFKEKLNPGRRRVIKSLKEKKKGINMVYKSFPLLSHQARSWQGKGREIPKY